MKKIMLMAVAVMLGGVVSGESGEIVSANTLEGACLTEKVGNITWTYTVIGGGKASVGGGYDAPAVPSTTTGAISIPSSLGGFPVTSIGNYAFRDCSGLTSVTMPSSATSIGNRAFRNCSGLTSVTIPEGVTSIGYYAFSGCSGLTSVTIPSSLTIIGDRAFCGCSGLLKFVVEEANPNYKSASGLLLTKDGEHLIQGVNGDVTIPEGVAYIWWYAFYGCSGLTSITIPSSVVSIEDHAFYGCSGLTSITIPSSVTEIWEYTFSGCSGLTSVTIPEDVTSIGEAAFFGCSGLTSVTIPEGVTNIEDSTFKGCSGFMSMTIPEGVTSIGYWAFSGCSGLTSVTIPSSVTSIGNNAFSGCSGLTSITIPSNVTSIGDSAFNGCYLDNVSVGDARFVWAEGFGLYDVANKKYVYSWPSTVASVVSTTVRESDPTVIDVKYKVTGVGNAADVRALAFLDGTTSFAKVIRPETFVNNVDGSPSEIGAGISLREEHKFAWKVSADYAGNLAKIKMQVFAKSKELLPLQLRTIPANGSNPAYEVTINTLTDNDVLNALYWLYANNDPDLTLANGLLKNGNAPLVNGTELAHKVYDWSDDYWSNDYRSNAASFVLRKMGYTVLNGSMLNYVNTNLRLGLSPSGTRQYGYKALSE